MKLSKSLFIFSLFILILSVGSWFLIIFPPAKFNVALNQIAPLINQNFINNYPSDLNITVKNGQVTYNRKTAFCLILDPKSKIGIVFDNRDLATPLNFTTVYKPLCQPLAYVGSNYVVYPDKNSTYKIQPLGEQVSFTLTQDTIRQFIDTYLPKILSFGRSLYYSFPFIAFIFLLLFFLSNNVWYAFVTKICGKLFGNQLDSGNSYAVSLLVYAVLIFINLVVIEYLLNTLGKANFTLSIPFFNTIVITIVSNLILKKQAPVPPGSDPSPIPPVK